MGPGLVLGLVATALGLGSAMVLAGDWRSSYSGASGPRSLDPRLVIAPRTITVQARLTQEARLSGTLTPTIPGANTLRLVVRDQAGAILSGGSLHLRTTMPGMSMAPISTTLMPQNGGYRGVLILPMFGRYRAVVQVDPPNRQYSGTLTLALWLPAIRGC